MDRHCVAAYVPLAAAAQVVVDEKVVAPSRNERQPVDTAVEAAMQQCAYARVSDDARVAVSLLPGMCGGVVAVFLGGEG